MSWRIVRLILIISVSLGNLSCSEENKYCIIGAGPAGVQLGYFFEAHGKDYVLFEKSNISGSFFSKYPRHGRLISINKRNTGSSNREFNLRHDWNSLLSEEEKLLFRYYSNDLFPRSETLVKYLNDFASFHKLNIKYNREIQNVTRTDKVFHLTDTNKVLYKCKILITATGLWKPVLPNVDGIHLSSGYEDVSTDPDQFEAKSVLVLGRGNSAFEIAEHVYSRTNFVHLLGRRRIRLAWETHYVGDIRAINNGILDSYQLKSMDGLLEYNDIEDYKIVKENGKLYLRYKETTKEDPKEQNKTDHSEVMDNDPLLTPYDKIVRCLGFKFDSSIFSSLPIECIPNNSPKYPSIYPDYQSTSVPDLYFAGTLAHSLDYRKSAGGFIHGFRYTSRALYKILSKRYDNENWPFTSYPLTSLVDVVIRRINEASGPYQMYGQLGDVIIIRWNNASFDFIEEFPVKLLRNFSSVTGIDTKQSSLLLIVFEYGEDYRGPKTDVFRTDRAATSPEYAFLSNFLHPVIYFYNDASKDTKTTDPRMLYKLPEPTEVHHVLEDFNIKWDRPFSHVIPLRDFIGWCTDYHHDRSESNSCARTNFKDELPFLVGDRTI